MRLEISSHVDWHPLTEARLKVRTTPLSATNPNPNIYPNTNPNPNPNPNPNTNTNTNLEGKNYALVGDEKVMTDTKGEIALAAAMPNWRWLHDWEVDYNPNPNPNPNPT